MFEGFESSNKAFTFPDLKKERGEFERVARTFNLDCDTLIFLATEEGKLHELDEEMWKALDNTDSYELDKNDPEVWKKVEECAEAHERKRDWKKFKSLAERQVTLGAPIIMKLGDVYHLVAGNTRLMIARALGIVPQVLVFEYTHDRTNEEKL